LSKRSNEFAGDRERAAHSEIPAARPELDDVIAQDDQQERPLRRGWLLQSRLRKYRDDRTAGLVAVRPALEGRQNERSRPNESRGGDGRLFVCKL
jgi:hypothetical protein